MPRLTIVLLTLAAAGAVRAEDFRVENKVFLGNEKEPRIESTTIFHEGVIYDYLKHPDEVTVFDKNRGRFILLDPVKRRKTEISTDEIEGLNKNLRQWASTQTDAMLQFLAHPTFDEQFDESSGELTFASEWLTYRVLPDALGNAQMAKQYRDFSDWYTLLNTRLNPGSRLPFARLVVNEALEKRGQLPKEVHLTMRAKRGLPLQKTTLRSEHHLVPGLVQSDRDRIRQTDEYLGMFPTVEFQEYQKGG